MALVKPQNSKCYGISKVKRRAEFYITNANMRINALVQQARSCADDMSGGVPEPVSTQTNAPTSKIYKRCSANCI